MGVQGKTSSHGSQSGFILLEVLAAFIVFALLFVPILQILRSSARTATRAQEFSQATLWAQSLMDTVGLDIPVEAGSYSGTFDDKYDYELTIDPYEADEDSEFVFDLEMPIELFRVETVVSWGNGFRPREARFVSLKAAVAEL